MTTDTEVQLAHNTVQNLMPTTKAALDNEFYKTAEWNVFVDQLSHAVARPGSAACPLLRSSLRNTVTGLVNGTRDVDYIYALQAALSRKA